MKNALVRFGTAGLRATLALSLLVSTACSGSSGLLPPNDAPQTSSINASQAGGTAPAQIQGKTVKHALGECGSVSINGSVVSDNGPCFGTDPTYCPPDESLCYVGMDPTNYGNINWRLGLVNSAGQGVAGGGGAQSTISYQGQAKPGKQCVGGAGANSGAIGSPISGPDTGSGPNGDEVNNVYLVTISSGSGGGAIAGNGGFFLTTFNGQKWYQLPVQLPIYNGPIYINMGNVSIANNGVVGTSTLTNSIANALSSPSNSGFSGAVKSAISAYLKGMSGQGTNASTPDCFSGPWNGTSQG